MSDLIIIYITCPSKEVATTLSRTLLEQRLIACANLYAIDSLYWWQGKITEEPEIVIFAKSTSDKYDQIKDLVEETHPYDVPCITSIAINRVNESYGNWIVSETSIDS